jgi:two-component system sensor histidine kinase DesK
MIAWMGGNMFAKLARWFPLETISALATWALVAMSALYFMLISDTYSGLSILLAGLLFSAFICMWVFTTSALSHSLSNSQRWLLLSLQYMAIIALYFTVPYNYTAILVTMWCCLLPHFFAMRWVLFSAPLWSAPLWLIYGFYWQQDHMFISSSLFLMFNFFALVMMNTTIKESKAREQANQLNRELLATQSLLTQASQQAERVRIARNIHDLLGHHLTALTINLQVVARITDGEAKQKVEQCHSLSKLLLSDVREAVAEIRDKSHIELKEALEVLLENVPELQISLHYAKDLLINDVRLADTLVKCVQEALTNCLKHTRASHFDIELRQDKQGVLLIMSDNGQHIKTFKTGNGLMGMQERVSLLGGKLSINNRPEGFHTAIEIPIQA